MSQQKTLKRMNEKIFFDNGGGTKLCGILDIPGKETPVVILCHGFASSKESTKITQLATELSRRGIGSFRFDFYGHGESEGAFAHITLSEGVFDIIAAYKVVHQQYPRSLIGICGSSFGGAAAFYAAVKAHFTAIALLCPAVFYKELMDTEKSSQELAEWKKNTTIQYKQWDGTEKPLLYGFYEDLENFTPAEFAAKITTHCLICHGTNDTVVPLEHSQRLKEMLPEAELNVFRGADHRFSDEVDRAKVIADVADYMAEELSRR